MNRFRLNLPFYLDVDPGPGAPAPSAPAPSDIGASASQPATIAAPPTATSPTTSPQPPATGGAPGDGWVPSYRLRESREAAQREAQATYQGQVQAAQAEVERYKSQLHALVGVNPPPNPQVSAVRDQFGQLYPGLSKIEERAQQIMELLDRAGDMESQTTHYWQTYGRQTMDRLFDKAETSIGGPLPDDAKRVLHSAFTGFVQSSPEMTQRYANDPTIVEDFWKAFSSSFIDPTRRAAAAQVAGRAPGALPQDTPGGVPRVSPVPQPQNLDERVANAWQTYQTTKTP